MLSRRLPPRARRRTRRQVFSSRQRNLDTERVDKATGELRPVRADSARQRYGEGGVDGLVWGTKYAIASVRSPLANHRVILGISHFDASAPGGEGRVFADLALDLARRSNGIHAFTTDGAWRGTHLSQIKTTTGRAVIAFKLGGACRRDVCGFTVNVCPPGACTTKPSSSCWPLKPTTPGPDTSGTTKLPTTAGDPEPSLSPPLMVL